MSVMNQYVERREAESAPEVPREFTDDERREGLLAMVACAGSARRAHELLAEHNLDVPMNTLASWKRRYVGQYDELREEYAPKIEQALVRSLRETAVFAAEVERKAIEEAERRLDEKKDMNPAGTAANLSKVKASAVDRLLTLTGRPQAITEHRSYNELVRSLASRGVIDLPSSEVQELPPMIPTQDAA
jgi:hypothetical protein